MRLLAVLTFFALSLVAVRSAAQPAALPPPIAASEYAARRDTLLARLGDGAAVLAFGERAPIGFPAFYQVPTFRYLTGFLEPDAALLLTRQRGATVAILFREPRSARDVITDGPPEDSAALASRTGLALRPLAALAGAVDSVLEAGAALHTLRDVRPYGGSIDSLTREGAFAAGLRRRTPAPVLRAADPQLDSMRARKSAAEAAMLRRAAEVTSAALRFTIARIRPGMREYEIQASIEHGFRSRGADRPGFATNVSADRNATVVHHRGRGYEDRRSRLPIGDGCLGHHPGAQPTRGIRHGDLDRVAPRRGIGDYSDQRHASGEAGVERGYADGRRGAFADASHVGFRHTDADSHRVEIDDREH